MPLSKWSFYPLVGAAATTGCRKNWTNHYSQPTTMALFSLFNPVAPQNSFDEYLRAVRLTLCCTMSSLLKTHVQNLASQGRYSTEYGFSCVKQQSSHSFFSSTFCFLPLAGLTTQSTHVPHAMAHIPSDVQPIGCMCGENLTNKIREG